MVLVDKENKLTQEQKLTLILWARKIDIRQVAKEILQGGMIDGEGIIKPVERWDKSIGKYVKPIFLEIGANGYGLKKEFNDDNEVLLYLHEMPKDVVNGSPEDFNNFVSVEEGTLTVKYEPEQVINFMYNEIYSEAQSIILNCLDDIYHKCNLERNQVERINKDNIINYLQQQRKTYMLITALLPTVMWLLYLQALNLKSLAVTTINLTTPDRLKYSETIF